MPAVPFVMAAATASGVAASIGAATAALVGATVTGAAAAAIGAGVLSAGVGLAQGKSISDSLKGAVIGGVASFIGAGIASDVTGSIVEAAGGAGASSISSTFANVAGSMAGGAARGAIGAVLSGQDPIEALIQGGLAAGVTSGIGEFAKEIPGFNDLKDFGETGATAQRAITSALAAGALGKDVGDAVTQSVLGSLSKNAGDSFGKGLVDYSSDLKAAYNDANDIETQLRNNIDQQNKYVEDYQTLLAEAQGKQASIQEKYNRYLQFNEEGDTESANTLAEEINREAPEIETARNNLAKIEYNLNVAKENYPVLEGYYADKKAALEETVNKFKEQEEENAKLVQEEFERAVELKETSEEKLGTELTQEQLDALVGSDNPAKAIEKVLENSEGKDAEAKKEMLENYLNVSDEETNKLTEAVSDDTSEAEQVRTLRSFGYTQEQIKDYLGTTNDISQYFTEPVELIQEPPADETPADVVDQLRDAGLQESEDLPYLPTDDDFVPTSEIEKPEETAPDVVDQLLNSGMPSPDEDFVPTLPAETQTPTGPGYYDEITGEFIPDENGGLQGPLGPETGNFDPNQKWEYSITRPGVWTNDQGEEIDLSYMPDRDEAMTGAELMERAGASPGAFRSGIRPPQGGGSGGAAPRPGGQPRPPAGGQVRPPAGGQPRPTAGGGGGAGGGAGAGAAAGILAGILGGGAAPGGVNAGGPRNPAASRNPAVDTIAGLAGQQQQNSMLNMMMNDKSEGAKIKSYKELFGEDLFGDSYVPPSARGYEAAPQQQFQSQDDDIEQFFRGGDVTDINTLLQILRG